MGSYKVVTLGVEKFDCSELSFAVCRGLEHTQAGYMIGAATTFKYSFDYHEGDIYWCTADCGWITGIQE